MRSNDTPREWGNQPIRDDARAAQKWAEDRGSIRDELVRSGIMGDVGELYEVNDPEDAYEGFWH